MKSFSCPNANHFETKRTHQPDMIHEAENVLDSIIIETQNNELKYKKLEKKLIENKSL